MTVLDASAVLAYLQDEPGAAEVADVIAAGAVISTINLAEVLSRAADRGADPGALAEELTRRGLLGGALVVEDFTRADAIEAARLRPLTRESGLSLADRACLALTRRLDVSVLTADRAWAGVVLGIDIRQIRDGA